MSKTKAAFFATVVFVTGCAVAAPVTILGFPVGGKFAPPKRNCAMTEIGSQNIKSSCWVGPPDKSKYGLSGTLEFVGQEKLPLWAANAVFEINVRRDGTLEQVKVSTPGSKEFAKVYDSIAMRFGPAKIINRGTSARWETPDVSIRLLCFGETCHADFSSTNVDPEIRERAERKKKEDVERPASV